MLKNTKVSLVAVTLTFVSSIFLSCGSDSFSLKKTPHTEKKTTKVVFDGASISQGIGASFSLSNRMDYFLKTNPKIRKRVEEKFPGKSIGFIFDYFFITNFPYWASTHSNDRQALIHSELEDLSKRFDVIFISELPNEYMLETKPDHSDRNLILEQVKHNDLKYVRNQMSIGLVTKLASRNLAPHKVRDQINAEIRSYIASQPDKFYPLDVGTFVRDMVGEKSKVKQVLTNSGDKVGVLGLYADSLHFNDIGQTLLLNRVLIPGLLKPIAPELIPATGLPQFLNEDPANFTEGWRNKIKKSLYKNHVAFEDRENGRYRLEFVSQKDFIESATFYEGTDSKANPAFSKFMLGTYMPKLMQSFIKKLDFSIPTSIKNGRIVLDMRKPIQSSEVSISSSSPNSLAGYSRDYWLITMAGFNTTYKFELIRQKSNTYQFVWTIFSLLEGQRLGFYREDGIRPEVKSRIESTPERYHRLVLKGQVHFSN